MTLVLGSLDCKLEYNQLAASWIQSPTAERPLRLMAKCWWCVCIYKLDGSYSQTLTNLSERDCKCLETRHLPPLDLWSKVFTQGLRVQHHHRSPKMEGVSGETEKWAVTRTSLLCFHILLNFNPFKYSKTSQFTNHTKLSCSHSVWSHDKSTLSLCRFSVIQVKLV